MELSKSRLLTKANLPHSVQVIPKQVLEVRHALSSATTVALLSVLLESSKLGRVLVPWSYEVSLGLREITVPDVFAMLQPSFWKTTLTWSVFQLIPLILAAMFNLRADASYKHTSAVSKSKSVSFDPVTFAVAKLLMIYLSYHTVWGTQVLSLVELAKLGQVVGTETMAIGAGISLLFGLYEAML